MKNAFQAVPANNVTTKFPITKCLTLERTLLVLQENFLKEERTNSRLNVYKFTSEMKAALCKTLSNIDSV